MNIDERTLAIHSLISRLHVGLRGNCIPMVRNATSNKTYIARMYFRIPLLRNPHRLDKKKHVKQIKAR